ncbi:unnamed protein product [Candidula unifasciata]|uniref:TATA element modulatory factor 1 TATA binding domain-containing protein n=1 Tax=Candidula unifasciata TaxID=100452 RepID=A0A8S3ZSS3_9EUPU|nr:unnamed protein product [Candidula unifasciata]
MSWWDTSGITSLASQALKNAQKKIDKVLEIDEGAKHKVQKEDEKSQGQKEDGDFWSGWLGGKKSEGEDDAENSPTSHSSWNLPWNSTGSGSENILGAGSSNNTKVNTEVTKDNPEVTESTLKKADVDVHDSEVTTLGSLPHRETDFVSPPSRAQEYLPNLSSDVSSVFLAHGDIEKELPEEENISVSESFNTGWQDFPMDDDVNEMQVDDNIDVTETSKNEHGFDVDANKNFENFINNTVQSTECENSDRQFQAAESLRDVENGKDTFDLANSNTEEDISVDFKSNVSIVPVDTSSGSAQNAIEELLSPAQDADISSDNICTQALMQQLKPLQTDTSQSADSDPVDDSKDTDANPDGSLSKCMSSGYFTATSEECVTEIVVSTSTSVNDMHPQGSSTPIEASPAEAIEPADASLSVTSCDTDLSIKSWLEEGALPSLHNAALVEASEFPGTYTDSEALAKPAVDDVGNTESGLPELMASSDCHKSQSDFMQDYVNIGSVNDAAQTSSFDGSTSLLEELHTSSELEVATSRTNSDLDLPGGGRNSSTGSSETSKFDSSIDTIVDRSILDSQSDVDLMEKEPPYSLFGDSHTLGSEIDHPEEIQSGQLNDSSQSLSSSYVKCMIEEAMEDFNKTEDSGSDNHSSGEKSESSKIDSELEKSIYSGHESSDEIETTTSSDIEIISAPTPNGDNKYHLPFDLDQGHHRSDSQSSSSAHSKAGEMDRMSPERGGASWRDDDIHHHDLHAVREEAADNPSHPERLLKKLAEMAEVLQARENKLVQLSKENHQLTEDNNILRNQLQQSEEAREEENADLTALTDEFTARIGEAEKKMQAVLKEKELLKQRLAAAEKELERRSGDSDLQALLDEKREQVEELLKEGEKLSKQQLQSNTIIKKLRAKEKESDTTISAQKKKLDEQAKELERLILVLDSKEEMEKKQAEAISQLNAAVQRQEKELIKHKSDLEDAQEKVRALQTALDNSYKEIAELHRSNASQDSKAQEAALSAEMQVREELKAAMEREQQRFRQERETFIMQVDDLRLEMAKLEKEHSRREDLLRQEITHLQERQQQDEARSQDLTHSVSSATRPLLRQIENLQATLGAQSSAWERVEKNLTDRLAEAQTALAMAQEKERTANDHLMELSARVASLEAANSRIKQEKAQLAAQVESDRSRLEELQDIRNSAVAQMETTRQKLNQELTQLKMDKVHLESQLNVERSRLENERKKTLTLEEQLRQAEQSRSRGTPSPSPSMSVSRQESMAGSMYEHQSPGLMNWSFHEDADTVTSFGGTKTSVYDSLRQSGAAVVFENLSSQLKLREGELAHMQTEISQLEHTRESMARELVNLTNQNEELLEVKKAHELLEIEFSELNNRYSAILQMYGEKEEEVQELKLDLQDVKEMYKSQIDALMAK